MTRHLKIAVLGLFFIFLLMAAVSMHPVGRPEATGMDDYFIENGQEETGSNNIVAAIVFDYRGMDTLGEASVLFAAATGVLLAVGRKAK